MSDSRTKRMIIERHRSNTFLQAPTLLPLQRSSVDLSTDQPTMQPDLAIVERAASALEQGETHYADVPGIAPLREKLASFLKETGLAGYGQENVLVTAGVQEGRFLAIQKVGELFGCVGLPAVVHPGARQAVGVRQLDVKVLPVDAKNGMLPTLAGLRKAMEGGCKLVYIESPVRLTGATYDSATVQEIADLARKVDGAVIWDQGLSPWVSGGHYSSLGALPDMAARVAVFGEAWPGVGLEHWFIGYLAVNSEWMEGIRSQKQIMSICTSTPSQYGALEAGDVYATMHDAQRTMLARLRQEAVTWARKKRAEPLPGSAVNVVALRVPDADRAAAELREAGFAFADGADYGAPGVLRLTVTPDNAIARAVNQLP